MERVLIRMRKKWRGRLKKSTRLFFLVMVAFRSDLGMEADREPLACKVLRKFLPKLASTLDPSIIATDLHSVDVIDDRVWEEARKDAYRANYDRCLNILEALIRNTRASSECFDKFCAILEDQEVTKALASQLREALKELEREDGKSVLANSE